MQHRPSLYQIQVAILKNVCAPDVDEIEKFTIERPIRSSKKYEGDSQLGILLYTGICTDYGYSYRDIAAWVSIDRQEYKFKLTKYKHRVKNKDERLLLKRKLINNYLKSQFNFKQ
jgi:hypothetical protein